jgi:hypothetical protein
VPNYLPYTLNTTAENAYINNAMQHYPVDVPGAPVPLNTTFATEMDMLQYLYDFQLAGNVSGGALLFTDGTWGFQYTVTFLVNTSVTNSLPIVASLYDTALLRSAENGSSSSFDVTFHPFPRTPNEKKRPIGDYVASAMMGFYLALGFCMIPALQTVNVVKERENKAKQLQLIMGLSPAYARALCVSP